LRATILEWNLCACTRCSADKERNRSSEHHDTGALRITRTFRGAACGRWPPRARRPVSSERRWTALRRPDGRLPGRRKAQHVIRHKSPNCKRHQCGACALILPAESNHHMLHLAARRCGRCGSNARHAPARSASIH
jgi:hypothetical protein